MTGITDFIVHAETKVIAVVTARVSSIEGKFLIPENYSEYTGLPLLPGSGDKIITTKDTKVHEGKTLDGFLRVPSCPSWFKLLILALEAYETVDRRTV